ncbi:MAG TPA: hypothetical protein VI356_11955 [Myxococcales bacterium]
MAQSPAWLGKSGQTWKLIVFLAVVLLSLSGIVWSEVLLSSNAAGAEFAAAIAGSCVLGLAAFTWFFRSVVCRACGRRVAWRIVRTQSFGAWLTVLLAARACPSCGNDPST